MKTIDVDGKRIKLQIWDTAGQERFMAISRAYYRGTMGVLLCYAINDRESFEKIEFWMEEVKKNANEKDVCMILVGMKSDLSNERVVSIDEGRQKAELLGIKFFETSAKNYVNLNEVFLALARDVSEALNKKKSYGIALIQINSGENNSIGNCFKCS